MQTAVIFNHETVTLDGERYSGCEFRGCRMVFRGGEPPRVHAHRLHQRRRMLHVSRITSFNPFPLLNIPCEQCDALHAFPRPLTR